MILPCSTSKGSFRIPARRDGSAAESSQLLHVLRDDLPHLGAFLIGSTTGEQVLIMHEARLMVLVNFYACSGARNDSQSLSRW